MTRREFGAVALAGAPFCALALHPARLAAWGPLTVGITTNSLRELPRVTGKDNVDEILRALETIGATSVELSMSTIEPAPPSVAPFMGGSAAYPVRVVLSPEQVARTNRQARADLAGWRLETGGRHFENVRAKFTAANIKILAASISFDESFTDAELDATFRQFVGLGVKTVASPLTLKMATRVKPYADRHGIAVAVHNQVEGDTEGTVGTADIDAVLRMSAAFRIKLDVGNITASNRDPLDELARSRSRVAYVVLKDRLRNNGASQPFGEGDTPIAKVIGALKSGASVPVMVEYDYIGLRAAVDEIGKSIAYVAEAAR